MSPGCTVSAHLYWVSRGSSNISRISTPSVQNLIFVTPCTRQSWAYGLFLDASQEERVSHA